MAGRKIEITVPEHLDPMIVDAMRQLDVLHGSIPHDEALILALIERGARAVIGTRSRRADQRPVTELTVFELADALGIVDAEEARRATREARERAGKSLEAAAAMFARAEGLRAIHAPAEPMNLEGLDAVYRAARQALTEHPEARVVVAVGYVTVANESHVLAHPPETIN